jgi:hypothetical protein
VLRLILGEIMSNTGTTTPQVSPVKAVLQAFVNYPTLLPSQSSVTEGRTPDCLTDNPSGTCEGHTHDYSDGYGGTYAKGE